MWQDTRYLAGSLFSLLGSLPTLRDSVANVPLGTSLPSAGLGLLYGGTFLSLDMTMSALGALLTGAAWSVIAFLRSPHPLGGRPIGGRDTESATRARPELRRLSSRSDVAIPDGLESPSTFSTTATGGRSVRPAAPSAGAS